MARVEWVSGWYDRIENEIHRYLLNLAGDVYIEAVHNCPVKTGALLADLDFEVNGMEARIGARSLFYAIYVEEGTSPHAIYPNTKQALYWKGAAHPVDSVNHPGATATHFLRRALYSAGG